MREKKIFCGKDYKEIDIFSYTDIQKEIANKNNRIKQNKRIYISPPKQKNLNDKNAKRYFVQIVQANFGNGGYVVHLTYDEENVPDTYDEAVGIAYKYLRRIAYRRKKLGLLPLKYILVTQFGRKYKGTHRIHHHILINDGLDRDEVENMWFKHKGTKKSKRVTYGWANADRIKPNEKGITELAGYLAKDSASRKKSNEIINIGEKLPKNIEGKKHWLQSQNLIKPYTKNPNDNKYSRRQIDKLALMQPDSVEFINYWEKEYKGWKLIGFDKKYYDETGWSFYLKMIRLF